MQKEAARKLIQDTLEGAFDKEQFKKFTKELLNHLEDAPFTYRGEYIYKDFRDSVKTLERIGKYEDSDSKKIDVLIVNLLKTPSLERARSKQRNFVAKYLKGSRGNELKHGALVAFVSPDEQDWRFSFVKMEYKFDTTKKGQPKVVEEFTPARRYSFLVGENEKSHTAQSRLLPILENTDSDPTLVEIEEAFSIEKVTKEFFENYRLLFHEVRDALDVFVKKDKATKADFQEKGIDTVDFTKKLLGQIVFLYFLQKKGWFGVGKRSEWGTGPKRFLRELFDKKHGGYKNFFNDILEPLFYNTLAVERPGDYSDKFDCRIPFLNGGLFDPLNDYDWQRTDILLSDNLFSNDEKTKQGDVGTGILDVFDRYNFTVKEDEPLEKEVAVDPEMLGKVFENLLEVKDRKSKGTYYTPREIVHYMCQESLINYLATELKEQVKREDIETLIKHGETALENDALVSGQGEEKGRYKYKLPQSIREHNELIDRKLAEITVCDPAVGSGAFLVGMMSEIVRTRSVLARLNNPDREPDIYKFKRDAIQDSLHGVDIDLGAVEIAKLRLWLSLIVDEEDYKHIKPLPNLDYKIMQGNSLLEEYEGIPLIDERFFEKHEEKELVQKRLKDQQSKLQREYFDLHSNDKLTTTKKSEIEKTLKKIEKQLKVLEQPKTNGQGPFDIFGQTEAQSKAEKLLELHEQFFNAYHKSEKDRLHKQIDELTWDLIETTLKQKGKEDKLEEVKRFQRTNTSPFFLWKLNFAEVFRRNGGFDVLITNPPYIGEKGHRDIFVQIKQGYLGRFYQRKTDVLYFFIHLSLDLAREGAQLVFITTNYFPTATRADKLRKDMKSRAIVHRLINFNELRVFESAKGQHNMITVLSKGSDELSIANISVTRRIGLATSEVLKNILHGHDGDTTYTRIPQNKLYEGEDCQIRFSGNVNMSKDPIQKVLLKMTHQSKRLGCLCTVEQGLHTGADKVSNKHLAAYPKLSNKVKKGDGIFVLSGKERNKLALNSFERARVLPLYKNSDIVKYYTKDNASFYFIDLSWPKDRELDLALVPNLLNHLKRFRVILENRKDTANGLQNAIAKGFWWPIGARKKLDFSKAKIVAPQRSKSNVFGYNEIPWYASADVYFITQKDELFHLKYILALLNSSLFYVWLYNKGKRKGEILELYQKPLSEIPIKDISADRQKPFVNLVDDILSITKSNDYLQNSDKQAKVKEYEKQIDQLVYKLYNLTPKEIAIVEGKTK